MIRTTALTMSKWCWSTLNDRSAHLMRFFQSNLMSVYILSHELSIKMIKIRDLIRRNRFTKSTSLIFHRKFRFLWWWYTLSGSAKVFFLNSFCRSFYIDRCSFAWAIRIWIQFCGIVWFSCVFYRNIGKKQIVKKSNFSLRKIFEREVGWVMRLFFIEVLENSFSYRLRPTAPQTDYPLLR
jgi:hypothetical protein